MGEDNASSNKISNTNMYLTWKNVAASKIERNFCLGFGRRESKKNFKIISNGEKVIAVVIGICFISAFKLK